eukprot:Plantae.Rhodophyta-Purpureofilum_apyrenoidigerum.ctg2591.p1 GENE.Plantae.Rhodophyta-Purpureofilum_apyrenoidigerum.ctg2591~~Plantae.Rhodophyta-Purpureofilum_apyrenoidigerum.ctg2591.p1  ORF type:complete len:179 (-),score=44.90 Plantae.Rhodophyta-Purpureofilum_apyrenoidigerum.ctg2591:99-635(-)
MAAFVQGGVVISRRDHGATCQRVRATARMSALSSEEKRKAGMTSVWDETIKSLNKAFPEYSWENVEKILYATGGDEARALERLASSSVMTKERQEMVNKYKGRVTVMEEGRMRRRATGSARDFFKAYVDVEGSYIEQGYVDKDADVMSSIRKTFGNLFGFGKKRQLKTEPEEKVFGEE